MSGIQSSIGVITGIPIQDTVDQLISISARPRDLLVSRTAELKQQQVAITELTAMVIGVQLASDNLGKSEIFDAVNVSSSNVGLVSTQVTGTPTKGSFSFRSLRQAQSHQLLSGRLGSDSEALGAGTLSIRSGGFVDDTLLLEDLNGGAGVERGQFRITDRSGSSAIIDLRNSATVRDVLDAINQQTGINVSAAVQGDSIVLTDNTGRTDSNLIVQQMGTASTASDLGLAGIDVASIEVTGADVVELSRNTRLSTLNDGSGVDFNASLAELEVTFRDNSAALQIDFSDEKTLGELLDTLNAADPARLQAQISADGDRIELIDLTTDAGGSFGVTSLYSGTTAEDLGLTGTAVGDTVTGGRIQGGLGTVLVRSLGGGNGGLGELGQLDLQDRLGNAATVDLAGLETLDEIILAINQSGVGVVARLNEGRNGIAIEDTSGGNGNLIVANNADGLETASKLRIEVDDAVDSIDSGSLDRQTVSVLTRLEDYNHGSGVDERSFVITDSSGAIGAINLATEGLETIGDVIDAINGLDIGVAASINATGDGIQLVDTAGGSGTMSVEESGTGSTAADLGLLGDAELVDLGAGPQQVISGSQTSQLEIAEEDTIDDLITKINDADFGVTASKFFDGVGYRISLVSDETGQAGRFQIQGLESLTRFSTVAEGQDALIALGDGTASLGVLASSSTNTFDQIIEGVSFTTHGVSDEVVTISAVETDSKVVSNVKLFIEQYNKLQEKLKEHTNFESNGSEDNPAIKTGLLFGSTETLRIDQAMGQLVSGRLFGAGDIRSLAEIGIDVKEDGQLELNEEKLKAKYATEPDSFEEFFTTETYGVAAKFNRAIEQLAGEGDSLLITRTRTLQSRIDANNERIEKMTESLEKERIRLLKQFVTLESNIQKLQANQTALSAVQPLPPLASVNS